MSNTAVEDSPEDTEDSDDEDSDDEDSATDDTAEELTELSDELSAELIDELSAALEDDEEIDVDETGTGAGEFFGPLEPPPHAVNTLSAKPQNR